MSAMQMFLVSCVLTKTESGEMQIQNVSGYRVASDGEDAVRGRYVKQTLYHNPGWSLGSLGVMEVLPDDMRTALGITP